MQLQILHAELISISVEKHTMTLWVYLPHFQEHLEGARRGFLAEDHWDMISCQNAILQSSHKSVPPKWLFKKTFRNEQY
jgi:hypothetical protein